MLFDPDLHIPSSQPSISRSSLYCYRVYSSWQKSVSSQDKCFRKTNEANVNFFPVFQSKQCEPARINWKQHEAQAQHVLVGLAGEEIGGCGDPLRLCTYTEAPSYGCHNAPLGKPQLSPKPPPWDICQSKGKNWQCKNDIAL